MISDLWVFFLVVFCLGWGYINGNWRPQSGFKCERRAEELI